VAPGETLFEELRVLSSRKRSVKGCAEARELVPALERAHTDGRNESDVLAIIEHTELAGPAPA
jgi:hypothetical protein